MALIVQKFGGTSVGTVERIRSVAERVIRTQRAGHQVVVVVSAMSGETNRLVDLAYQISRSPSGAEKDLLLATGKQVTIALLGLMLKELGQDSISFTGSQVQIKTDSAHTKARIVSIAGQKILDETKKGRVVIIAGFQGVTDEDISRH